jgi:hypothetical protein
LNDGRVPALTRHQLPTLVLVALSLSVAGWGLANAQPWTTEYPHYVTEVSEVPADADGSGELYRYEHLSPRAKAAFEKALRHEGETVYLSDEKNKPLEFTYSDHFTPGHGQYYIEYRGEYYELRTAPTPWPLADALVLGVSLTFGVLGLAVGYRAARRERPRLPLAALVGVACLWGAFEVGVYELFDYTQANVAVGFVLTVVPAVAAWYLLGRAYALSSASGSSSKSK